MQQDAGAGNGGQATILETPRLLLRRWRESDRVPFAAMNADPDVMRYFPATLSAADSDLLVDGMTEQIVRSGVGFWAAQCRASGEFAGFIGLNVPVFAAPFMPCVEIGWRLARRFWNQGLATEGAAAVLAYGHGVRQLPEIVAFTAANNLPSRRVMEKIGMTRDVHGDFDHPRLPPGHALARHVLYRSRGA
jgi:RimJ/RimL family protein N-acetyltransferase